jgi:hypothetical protein
MATLPCTGNLETDVTGQLQPDTLLRLFDHGIVTSQQLVGKFLGMRYTDDTAASHCHRFVQWLHFVHERDRVVLLDFAGSCANQCFPNSYDPSVLTT